jgi:polysaccharide export outer membrane protein
MRFNQTKFQDWTFRLARQAVGAAVVALMASGCAYSPGTMFGPTLQGLGQTKDAEQPSTLARMFQGKGAGDAAKPSEASGAMTLPEGVPDAPPPGVLRSITPALIQQLQAEAKQANTAESLKSLFGKPVPYTIGSGDVVNIMVWGHPELVLAPAGSTATSTADANSQSVVGNGFNVSPEGLIQFPLIGTIKLAGLTENQARMALTDALKRYIVDPQVTLRLQAYRAGRIYIEGEVRLPGQQAINDVPMTLPEALSRAGGLTTLADRSQVFVSRNGVTLPVSLIGLAERGISPAQILLASNDLVRVASRDDAKVYVMGEVVRQMALQLRNGRLSLNEALGESGGINPASGDPRQVFVIRSRSAAPASTQPDATQSNAELPEIFHLDARSPMGYALAEGFELKPRDVVYVDPVPLVRWNRVISLILPSAQAVVTSKSALN